MFSLSYFNCSSPPPPFFPFFPSLSFAHSLSFSFASICLLFFIQSWGHTSPSNSNCTKLRVQANYPQEVNLCALLERGPLSLVFPSLSSSRRTNMRKLTHKKGRQGRHNNSTNEGKKLKRAPSSYCYQCTCSHFLNQEGGHPIVFFLPVILAVACFAFHFTTFFLYHL